MSRHVYRGHMFTINEILPDLSARLIAAAICWLFIPPLCGFTWIAIFFVYYLITGEPLWQ